MRHLFILLIAVSLSACFSGGNGGSSSPSPELSIATESIFPHEDNWKDVDQHGLFVKLILMFDTTYCMKCHTVSGPTDQGGPPPCQSCHKVFPHAEAGITTETHGALVLQQGTSACATQCHGTNLKGGASGVACVQCHATYPHPSQWKAAQQHGVFVKTTLKSDTTSCTPCHGKNLEGDTGPSCYSCHTVYPHDATSPVTTDHGKFVTANGQTACATQCHGTDLKGGLSQTSCTSCHASYPHVSGWKNPQGHGIYVKDFLKFDSTACTACHGKTLEGAGGPSCYSCHTVYPHDARGITPAAHGPYVVKGGSSACATQCHGTDLKGGLSGTACTQCHATYPHATAWKNSQNHGLQAIGALKNNCTLCHGADLLGGNSTVSCQKCHTQYPHPSNWKSGSQHGAAVAENGTSACATQCHGADLKGYPADADVAQKKVPGCGDCHLALPHAPLGQWDHGQAKVAADGKLDTDACILCHGSNLTGNGKIPSCYSCHITYPDLHRANGWKTLSGHGTTVLTAAAGGTVLEEGVATCTICHGTDLLGGVAKTSCYGCHTQYPHAATWPDNHGQSIHTNADAALQTVTQYVQSNCTTSCHDFTADKNAPACANCHDPQNRYPHPQGWAQAFTDNPNGGDHGLTVVAAAPLGASTAASIAGCLTACHGTDGKNGFLDVANQCTTCHSHYPHAADWKGPTGDGYSIHGQAVLTTQGTATKDDDEFDATNFGECAKCHGDPVTLTDMSWWSMLKFIDLPNGKKVPRCNACHYYPHTTYEKWGGPQPWIFYHSTVLNNWYYSEHFDVQTFPGTKTEYAQKNCGGTYNSMGGNATSGGCHTDGPRNYTKGSWISGCNLCHMPKP